MATQFRSREEAVKNGKKGGKNRECLNCRLTVDIFDRSGEKLINCWNKMVFLDIAKERRADERTCVFKER